MKGFNCSRYDKRSLCLRKKFEITKQNTNNFLIEIMYEIKENKNKNDIVIHHLYFFLTLKVHSVEQSLLLFFISLVIVCFIV